MSMKEPMWVLRMIDSTAVVYPALDLFPHDLTNTQCRCSPKVQILGNGGIMISHNMLMVGWFLPNTFPTSGNSDELHGFSVD